MWSEEKKIFFNKGDVKRFPEKLIFETVKKANVTPSYTNFSALSNRQKSLAQN